MVMKVTDNIEQTFRCERKYMVDEISAHQIRYLVRMHPAIFKSPYPSRYINNIYFDTKEMTYYYENVNGVKERRKVRLRWYGDLYGNQKKPVLEFKIKDGFVGTKQHYRLASFSFDEYFDSEYFNKILEDSDIPQEIKYYMRDLNPVLTNRYHRYYYESIDKRFRVTVDDEMSFYNIKRFKNTFRYKFIDHRNIIVELKYDKEIDNIASRISQFFPFAVTKNSKYVQGIETVYV